MSPFPIYIKRQVYLHLSNVNTTHLIVIHSNKVNFFVPMELYLYLKYTLYDFILALKNQEAI
jgi:hypothetical protein